MKLGNQKTDYILKSDKRVSIGKTNINPTTSQDTSHNNNGSSGGSSHFLFTKSNYSRHLEKIQVKTISERQ